MHLSSKAVVAVTGAAVMSLGMVRRRVVAHTGEKRWPRRDTNGHE
jgi:hypothetical protein